MKLRRTLSQRKEDIASLIALSAMKGDELKGWWGKQKRLKHRRNDSWSSHINLSRRFAEIDADPYVKMSREKYAKQ